jgi:hypothetical protein
MSSDKLKAYFQMMEKHDQEQAINLKDLEEL